MRWYLALALSFSMLACSTQAVAPPPNDDDDDDSEPNQSSGGTSSGQVNAEDQPDPTQELDGPPEVEITGPITDPGKCAGTWLYAPGYFSSDRHEWLADAVALANERNGEDFFSLVDTDDGQQQRCRLTLTGTRAPTELARYNAGSGEILVEWLATKDREALIAWVAYAMEASVTR